MAKRKYASPILSAGLTPDDDPTIVIGGSQGSSGFESMWSFGDDITEEILAMIELNCDDFDLQDMDADHDYLITLEEFEAWFKANNEHW